MIQMMRAGKIAGWWIQERQTNMVFSHHIWIKQSPISTHYWGLILQEIGTGSAQIKAIQRAIN